MDSLLVYGSSSDEDHTINPSVSSSNLSSTTNNYFNLSNSDDDKDEVIICHVDQEKKKIGSGKKIVMKSGETIEIPDTDFWKKSSSILQNSPPEEPRVLKRPRKDQTVHAINKIPKVQTVAHENIPVVSESVNDRLAKTCFFVHHRVAPHLVRTKSSQAPSKKTNSLSAHSKCVNHVSWSSPQFSHLLLSCSMDGLVKVWDAFSSQKNPLRILNRCSKGVKQAVWSSTGKEILCGSYDKVALLYDVLSGKEAVRCPHEDYVTTVQFHPKQSHLFVSGGSNRLLCWDVRKPSEPFRKLLYKDAFGQVQDICFNSDGSEFFTCNDQVCKDSSDRNVMAWDFEKGVVVSNQIFQERYTCTRLKFHPNSQQFVAQTQGNYIAVFSAQRPYKMNRNKRFQGHFVSGYSVGCDFSPDGRLLASGSSDGAIYFYDFKTGKNFRKIQICDGRDAVCVDVAWHPLLPSLVATSTWNGEVVLCH